MGLHRKMLKQTFTVAPTCKMSLAAKFSHLHFFVIQWTDSKLLYVTRHHFHADHHPDWKRLLGSPTPPINPHPLTMSSGATSPRSLNTSRVGNPVTVIDAILSSFSTKTHSRCKQGLVFPAHCGWDLQQSSSLEQLIYPLQGQTKLNHSTS